MGSSLYAKECDLMEFSLIEYQILCPEGTQSLVRNIHM